MARKPQTFLSDRDYFLRLGSALALIVFAVFANSFGNQFTNWDDRMLVLENAQVTEPNLVGIFTPEPGRTYQPVRVLSYAIDYALWGDKPLGYHIVNTALHATAAILLMLLLTRIFDALRGEDQHAQNRLAAAVAAALFALHPINVESVTWLSSRKYGLLASCGFGSLLAYLISTSGEKLKRIPSAISAILMLLALLSSPFAVSLPPLLIYFDFCRDRFQRPFRRWRGYAPVAVVALAYPLIWLALMGGGESNAARKWHEDDNAFVTTLSMLSVLWDYAVNLACPLFLNNKYPREIVHSIVEPRLLAALILIAGVSWLMWRSWQKKAPLPLFLGGWFLVCWLPVSNIIPISTMIADRYMYLPAVAIFAGFGLLVQRKQLPIAAVVFLLLAGISIARNRVWANSVTLWADSVSKGPNNAIAQNNYGMALKESGRDSEAGEHFLKAVAIHEAYPEAQLNLSVHYQDSGQGALALPHLQRALELDPKNGKVQNGLGIYHAEFGDPEEAMRWFQRALESESSLSAIHTNIGRLHRKQGRTEAAIAEFAIAAGQDQPQAHYELGALYGPANQQELAFTHLNRAIALKPDYAEAHNNLGIYYARQGNLPKAAEHFATAVRIKPDYQEAINNLARAQPAK
ncbi:MAG: tetratricopeptide (TPR) repeat protein [Rhodothermales bacterium]|jgi:tetratricopeptide (TPR) repeat protein